MRKAALPTDIAGEFGAGEFGDMDVCLHKDGAAGRKDHVAADIAVDLHDCLGKKGKDHRDGHGDRHIDGEVKVDLHGTVMEFADLHADANREGKTAVPFLRAPAGRKG